MASRRPVLRLCAAPFARLTLLALAAASFACGKVSSEDDGYDEREAAPSAAEPAESNVTRVRERAEPDADDDSSASPGPRASGSPAAGSSGDDAPEAPAAPEPAAEAADPPQSTLESALTFAACSSAGGPYAECESIYVTAVQASPARCIQLTIDNCGTYGRQGLSADAPTSWRLASGSVGEAAAPCELGAFYAGNASIADATGSISWNEDTPRPTELVFDLRLELLGAEGDSIDLATSEPLQPTECED